MTISIFALKVERNGKILLLRFFFVEYSSGDQGNIVPKNDVDKSDGLKIFDKITEL